jgi:archaellum component FlaC
MFKFLKKISFLEQLAENHAQDMARMGKKINQQADLINGLQNQINDLKPKKKTK